MPEGPEVHTVADVLHAELSGRWIIAVDILPTARYADGIPGDRLYQVPLLVQGVVARGKRILFHLDDDHGNHPILISFLAMTGHWTIMPVTEDSDLTAWCPVPITHHAKIRLTIASAIANLWCWECYLYYSEPRPFGYLYLASDMATVNHKLRNVGPDLIADDVTLDQWLAVVTRPRLSRMPICRFLLAQRYFSSIGNYAKCDVMYVVRLHPERTLGSLSAEDRVNLYTASTQILKESYACGGLTIQDYWDPYGRKGNYQSRVYERAQDDLGNPVVKTKFSDGRTTHWVPQLQT